MTASVLDEDPWAKVPPNEPPAAPPTRAALNVRPFATIASEVDARGPRRWLVRGIWPAGDYGVHGAEPKAGKTWNALDLAVSVASGTPWLGALQVDTTGPVIVFAGEGGDGNIVRRVRAIADGRQIDAADLALWICTRAPHLAEDRHLTELERIVTEVQPALVILDPLYLAAGGANGADLYAMGKLLERPQHICQAVQAALLVVTHYNRARDLKGAARLTGAGPAEWGRVLLAAEVVSRHTDDLSKTTTVLSSLTVTGGEVPDQTLRVRRVVRAIDPDNLDSPLTYAVDMPDADDPATVAEPDMPPAAAKLLAAITAQDDPATVEQLVDWINEHHGHGLKRQTCSTHLNTLRQAALVDYLDQGNGRPRLWFLRTAKGDTPR